MDKLQLVQIQSVQSVADSIELNLTYKEVTNYMKLRGAKSWVTRPLSSWLYCEYETDATRVRTALSKHLAKYKSLIKTRQKRD